jgi:hypothetical protein
VQQHLSPLTLSVLVTLALNGCGGGAMLLAEFTRALDGGGPIGNADVYDRQHPDRRPGSMPTD